MTKLPSILLQQGRRMIVLCQLLIMAGFLSAQCPGGCDIEITAASSTNYTLNPGDTMCLQTGAIYTGTVQLVGGVLYNCATVPQNFNLDMDAGGGEFYNYGTFDFGSYDIEDDGILWNYGSITWSGFLSIQNNGQMHNFGTISNPSQGIFINGSAHPTNAFKNYNTGLIEASSIDFTADGFSSGTINVTSIYLSVGYSLVLDGSCLNADDLSSFGTIIGNTCSTVDITNNSYVWSSGAILGNIAFLDNPSFPFVDINQGTIAGSVTGTSCGCPGCSVTFAAVGSDITCFGGTDGSIDVTITGGYAPYTIDWDNDGTGDNDDTQDLSGLVAGTYNVTITDANFCSGTATVIISEPALLELSETHTDLACNGDADGSITLSVTGGTGTATIDWEHIPGMDDGLTLSGLSGGTYTAIATDTEGCDDTVIVDIVEPSALAITESHVDVDCNGNFTGSIDITASGGTSALGDYTYDWADLVGNDDIDDRVNLGSATYDLTVTDDNSCTSTISIAITEPTTLVLTETHSDPDCANANTGSIELSISGGSGTPTVDWTHMVGTDNPDTLTTLADGTYKAIITDDNGCQDSVTVVLNDPAELQISLSRTNITCFGADDGTIDLTITGGTGTPTADWDNVAGIDNPPNQTGLSAGSYAVTVTDTNGCTASGSISISEPSVLVITEDSLTQVSCFGDSDGAIYISTSGGFGSHIYTWDNIPGSPDPEDNENLTAGTYNLTVTDQSGCTATYTQSITQPSAALALSSTYNEPTCSGIDDGSIDLTISGGVTPYTIDWDNIAGADNPEDQNSIGSGTYNVTVTDNNGCTETHQVIVTVPASVNISESVTHNLCFGDTLGTIDVSITGGVTPYTYDWAHISGTNNVEDIINLGAGTYDLTVTDFNGCTSSTSISVTEPPAISIGETHSDPTCFGATDGTINLVVSGGTPTYTYDWDHIVGNDNPAFVSGLGAGDYQVIVTDDNLCSDTATITLIEPALLTITESHNDVSCFGANDGSVDITVSGGNGSTTFDWDHIGGPNNTQNPTGLASGTYQLIATDSEGCDDTISVDITAPTSALAISNNNINESCPGNNDGQVAVIVTGGTAPYNYDWRHIAGTNNNDTLFNHTGGTYVITVTDNNGCIETSNITLDTDATFSVSHTQVNVDCNGNSTGSIDITVSGGTAPFRYDWDHIGGPNNTDDPGSLAAGIYTVIITDATDCSVTYPVTITEPGVLTINDSQTNVSCFGGGDGTITITMTGGTAGFNYQWGHTAADVNALSSLSQGTYDLTVTDAQGCVTSSSITITEPTDIVLSETHIDVSCNGGSNGSINLTAAGGTVASDYDYDWNTDASGDFDDLQDIAGLSQGTYNVVVRDDNGCLESLTIDIMEPPVLTISESHVDVYCNGDADGSIDVTVNGGSGSYNYDWDHITGTDNVDDPTSLVAGNYTVTVTDSLGCTAQSTVTIGSTITITLSNTHMDISCNGGNDGSIDLTISGNGTSPYDIDWDNNGLGDTDDPQFLSDLVAGTYNVTVVDNNGCSITLTETLSEPTLLTTTATHDSTTCYSLTDGTATVSPAGGSPGYTYLWSNGETTSTITGLSAGTYTATVTDAQGCISVSSTTVPLITILEANATVTSNYSGEDISCFGTSDGSLAASVVANSGLGPYSYAWTGGITTSSLDNRPAGIYQVTITDSRGCIATAQDTLFDPPAIVVDIDTLTDYSGFNISCDESLDGEIQVISSGGIGGHIYTWSHSASTSDVQTGLGAGTYTVTVTDSEACAVALSAVLTNPDTISLVYVTSDYNGYEVSCEGGSDGSISLTPSGGAGGYTYQWSHSASTSSAVSGLSDGIYTVTITDANGCAFVESILIEEPPTLSFTTLTAAPTDCGTNDGIVLVNASGGTGNYEYSLDGVLYQSTNSFIGLAAGNYSIYVRNEFGTCETGPLTAVVDVPLAPNIDNVIIVSPSVIGATDGGILVRASGNGLAYRYRLDGGPWQTSDLFSNLGEGTYSVEVSYVGQNCITSQTAELIAGNGVIGNFGNATQYCSADLSGTQFIETYYIPWPEDQVLASLRSIYTNAACSTGPPDPIDSILNYNAIGVTENNTIIVYDHFEGGYESNIAFPVQPSTEIWGDGDVSNGAPPGIPSDILNAGNIIILDNTVQSTTRSTVLTDYDGGDKFASRGKLSFTRMTWASGSEALFAGALEVQAREEWGTYFESPVGESYLWNGSDDIFSYTGAVVMTGSFNTRVDVDLDGDGSTDNTYFIDEGESQLIDGGLNVGSTITTSHPTQVHLITGHQCAAYESRTFTLSPVSEWSRSYFNPVSSPSNDATVVHIYNPNSFAINVTAERNSGVVGTVGIAPNSTFGYQVPDNTGTKFYSGDGDFYAIASIDSRFIPANPGTFGFGATPADPTAEHDWGFALLPEELLSGQLSLVPFARGETPNTNTGVNANPIFITADYPSMSTNSGSIKVCIDDDGDGGTTPDPLGGEAYDRFFNLSPLDMQRIFDPNDNDQSGTRIWVCDGSDAIIAGAWGQDPSNSTPSNPLEMDLGTGLTNTIPFSVSKCVDLVNDFNNNGKFDECDEIEYKIIVRNVGSLSLSTGSLLISDTLSTSLDYLINSTRVISGLGVTPVPDEVATSTEFPLDESGYTLNQLIAPGDSIQIVFDASIRQSNTAIFVQNIAHVSNVSLTLSPEVSFPVEIPTAPDLPEIPTDTLISCSSTVLVPPFQDTCLNVSFMRQSRWALQSVSSQELIAESAPASNAFDGDPDTYWHTQYTTPAASYPHSIELDLGQIQSNIIGIQVIPNQSSANSHIGDYAFEYWDGASWISVVSGSWVAGFDTKEATFDNIDARFVRLRALTSASGTNFAGAAEINIMQCATQLIFNENTNQTNDSSYTDFNYFIERTWTISDNCGNTGDQVQTITVVDTTAPVMVNIPSDITVDPDNIPDPPTIVVNDDCQNPVTVDLVADTTYAGCTSIITRRWSVTDVSGNITLDSQVITVNGGYNLEMAMTTITCFGGNDGTASAAPLGGASPYSYTWSNGANTDTITGISSGWYYVTVSDANLCQSIDSIEVSEPTEMIVTVNVLSNVSCNGGSDGAASLSVSGGTGIKTYLWSNGATSTSVSGLIAGAYGYTVTDANGCTESDVVNITEPSALNSSIEVVSDFSGFGVSCNGNSDGITAVVPTGGSTPYTFSWSNGSTTDTIFNVSAGSYSVTISDANDCFETLTIDVTSPTPLIADAGNDLTLCSGASTTLFAGHTGGVGSYSYVWDNPTTTDQIKNVTPGSTTDYSVTVTDGNGCTSIDVVSVTIGACTEICNNNIDDDLDGDEDCADSDCTYATSTNVISDYNGQNISCNGASDGSAFVLPQGGVGPHTFLWDDATANDTLSNVGAGRYFVTVTDANGCTAIDSIELTQPSLLTGTATVVADISCNGGSDGVLTANPVGGTAPYTYLWSDGGAATTKTVTDLSNGSYFVTISDVNGCMVIAGVSLADPVALSVSAGSDQDVCIGTSVNLMASATGGAGGYTYLWDNGLGVGASKTITALSTTTYEVIVTDQNGCQETDQIIVTIVSCLEDCTNGYDDDLDGLMDCDDPDCGFTTMTSIVTDYNGQDISCYGATDDTITVTATGGVGPYTYLWSEGSTDQTIFENGAGIYYVTVTDNNGCTVLDTIEVVSPPQLIPDAGGDQFMCLGEDVTLTASHTGGNAGHTYTWDNGLGAGNGFVVSPSDTTTYTVTVTDNNGCTSIDSTKVTITPCPEDCSNGLDDDLDGLLDCDDTDCQYGLQFTASPSTSNLCFGDAGVGVKVEPLLSAGPYLYTWAHGPTTDSIGDLSAGMYYVTVTNVHGCTSIDSIEITEPSLLTSTTSGDQNICPGSPIALIATGAGGTSPYTYVWDNSLGAGQSFIVNPLVTTNYKTTITDANGCIKLDSILITIIPCTEDCSNGIDDDLDGDTDCEDSDCTYGTTTIVLSDYNGEDVTCVGAADGSARVVPLSGASPHTYLWDEGTTNDTILAMSARRYFVTVTDANGCTAVDSIDIEDPILLEVDAGVDIDICLGQSTTINAMPIGGASPHTYLWDNGLGAGQGHLVSPSDTTMYHVTITDANGCAAIDSVRVNITPCGEICNNNIDDDLDGDEDCDDSECSFPIGTSIISNYNGEHISCASTADGSARAWPLSGFAPYTYSWSTGSTNDTLTNVGAGRYHVTITDANGCSTVDSIDILEPNMLSGTVSADENICIGTDVDLTAAGSDGTAPYTYFWSQGLGAGADHTVTPGDTTTYIVTITDANGCTFIDSTVVTLIPCAEDCTNGIDDDLDGLTDCDDPDCGMTTTSMVMSDYNTYAISCFGGNDGEAYVEVTSGGVAPYVYLWSTSVYGDTVRNGSVGMQYVTITDNNGCTAIDSVEFTEPTELLVIPSLNDTICMDSSTVISASASGGVGGYTYVWDNTLGNGMSHSVTPTETTTYQVTAFDQNGCSSTAIVVITVDPCVEICDNGIDDDHDGLIDCADPDCSFDAGISIVSDYNGTMISCNSADDGSLSATANGGIAPFTYTWNTSATTNIINSLSGGQYHVTITDANGCTARDTTDLVEPDAIQLSETSIDVSCFGAGDGSINLAVSGGTGVPTFVWSNGATSEDINDLDPGFYTVRATDVNGCFADRQIQITGPDEIVITETHMDILCYGDTTGSITAMVTGGVGAYSYQWDNDGTADSDDVASVSDLGAGTYGLTVTDGDGCAQSISVTLNEPTSLSATITPDAAICRGDTITLTVSGSGGATPYTYDWDNALGSGATHDVDPLDTTTYNVTITDANGCTIIENVTISIQACPEDCTNGLDDDLDGLTDCDDDDCSFTVNLTVISDYNGSQISCNGASDGSIASSIVGGVAPYTYAWSNGATTDTIRDLGPATYEVTVTDVNGCSAIQSISVSEPAAVTLLDTHLDVSCFGASDGSINLAVSGGTGVPTFVWSNGATSEDINDLDPGFYTVRATDVNGCFADRQIQITGPGEIVIAETHMGILCNGDTTGSITTTVTGGVGAYSYQWDNDGTADSDDVASVGDLGAGTYGLTVTDDDGCAQSISVTLNEPTSLSATITPDAAICRGDTVTLTVTGSGGATPYTYHWDNALGSGATHDGDPLDTTTYTVTITDANGCTIIENVTISIQACPEDCTNGLDDDFDGLTDCDDDDCSFLISLTSTTDYNGFDISCHGQSDGGIQATITGGVGPYSYNWDSGHNVDEISGLPVGIYTLNVVDANGCSSTAAITLVEPLVLDLLISTEDATCNGAADGTAEVFNVVGGAAPFTYDWNNDSTGDFDDASRISNLTADIYLVEVRDANGCSIAQQAVVDEPDALVITDTLITSPSCNGLSDGRIDIDVIGGSLPYAYQWDNDGVADTDDTDIANGLAAGDYLVTITDGNGCMIVEQYTVAPKPTIEANASPDQTICDQNTVKIGVRPTNVTEPYTTTWGVGVTRDSIEIAPISSAYYTYRIEDAAGCSTYDSIYVEVLFCNDPATAEILGGATMCGSDSTTLELRIVDSDGSGPYEVVYTDGSQTFTVLGAVSGDGLVVSPSVTSNFDLIRVTDLDGLDATLIGGSVLVTVLPTPENISFVPIHSSTVCSGDSLGFRIEVENGIEPYNLEYTDGDSTYTLANYSSSEVLYYTPLDSGALSIVNFSHQGACPILDVNAQMTFDTMYCDPCPGRPDAPIAAQSLYTICDGELLPPFLVTTPLIIATDWYDAPVGGTLLTQNSNFFIPTDSITVYAEARNPNTGCVSSTRTRIELVIHSNPVIANVQTACAVDSTFYTIEFFSDGDQINISHGLLQSTGVNTYLLDSIPNGQPVTIESNFDNGCSSRTSPSVPVCRSGCTLMPMDTLQIMTNDESSMTSICIPAEFIDIDFVEVYRDDIQMDAPLACTPDSLSAAGFVIDLPTGDHWIELVDLIDMCSDSIFIRVNYTEEEIIRERVYLGEVGSVCLDHAAYSDPTHQVSVSCEDEEEVSAQFTWDGATACMQYNALSEGIDTICIVSLSPGGDRVITTLLLEIIHLTTDQIDVSLPIDSTSTTTVCVDTTHLIGNVSMVEVGCEPDTTRLTYDINAELACIDLSASEALVDTLCVIVCDDLGGCDTTIVIIDTYVPTNAPVAVNDTMATRVNTDLQIEVLINDNISDNLEDVQLTSIPYGGNVEVLDDMTIIYTPFDDMCGIVDSFSYRIQTEHGADEAMVYVDVSCNDFVVYNGFSPNGDGINEGLTILGIEDYEDNSVHVFNRWGNEVFYRENYSNNDQWTGDWNGSLLPSGTYFYMIKDKNHEVLASGYIQILR